MNIKEKDLRIGNIIYYNDKVHYVTAWTLLNCGFNKFCSPILLTEEILQFIGFEKVNQSDISANYEIPFSGILFNIGVNSNGFYNCQRHYVIDFKYLHELQNIFYFIVGRELNIPINFNPNIINNPILSSLK